MTHNHFTRDIKPQGQCPGCDEYHANEHRRAQQIAEALQRAQQIAQEVIREAPEDADLSVTFAEFKRRLKGPRP